MKRLVFCLLGIALISKLSTAQNDVLLTVAGEKITKSEFIAVYNKNNVKGEVMDKKSLNEYLDLYINFKLKVKEAEEQKLDTFTSFKTELAGYRKQLAQPYLTDRQVDEYLIQEAYERMQQDIRASHILIRINKDALPEDTLAAYKKIMKIRDRILKGEAFDVVAKETSEDPSSRDREDPTSKSVIKGNGGDLGYFTVLDMIYPFENGAYNTEVGKISMPIRTDYGYHLIKVTNKRPAMGKVVVAHIFVSIPRDAKPEDLQKYKDKIFVAYNKIKDGAKYEDIASEYSDDKGSASKGGALPGFGVNKMVPEFIDAIAELKNTGDYSAPVQTIYGWHIIKLIERKPVKSFDDEKIMLKNRILKDSRSNKSRESIINRIKNDYNFREYPETIKDFYTVVDSSVFDGKWDAAKAENLTKTMFTLGNKTYTQKDFTAFLSQKQVKRNKSHIQVFVNERYETFVEESCLQYEDSKLDEKYPEFKSLMKEYRDGIMLFELTDKKVWSKAIQDTNGLKDFYEKNKTKYMWGERVDATIFTCKDDNVAKSTRKLLKNYDKGKIKDIDILKKINTDTITMLKMERKLFSKDDNPIIDNMKWEKYISDNQEIDKKIVFVMVHKVIPPEPKQIKEAKGLITADYQNYLEEEWIKQLRAKYPYQVNQAVFESILK